LGGGVGGGGGDGVRGGRAKELERGGGGGWLVGWRLQNQRGMSRKYCYLKKTGNVTK